MIELLEVGCIALIVWWVFTFLKKHAGLSFSFTPVRTALYFAFASLVLLSLYPHISETLLSTRASEGSIVLFLFMMLLVNPTLYLIGGKSSRGHRIEHSRVYKHLEFLYLEYSFLFSKFFDVVFQQICVGIFISLLFLQGFTFMTVSLIFAVAFLIAHVGMLHLTHTRYAIGFLVIAFLAGLVLPAVYLMAGGFYVAVALHMTLYVLLGVVLRSLRLVS